MVELGERRADPGRTGDEMHRFVTRIQDSLGVTEAEAAVLSRVTVRHLGEQISDDHVQALSGVLPAELSDELRAGRGPVGGFDKDDFVDAVAAHVRCSDVVGVEEQVHAVLSTVRRWAPGREVEETLAELPASLAVLFA